MNVKKNRIASFQLAVMWTSCPHFNSSDSDNFLAKVCEQDAHIPADRMSAIRSNRKKFLD